MKFSLSFFQEYIPTPLTAQELGDALTMIGFELEETFEAEGETCLDMNIMANRGDAASILGFARELAAKRPEDGETDLFKRARARFPLADEASLDAGKKAKVSIQTEQCTRYAARVYEDVENGTSPEWLQTRLKQCGQRPISLLVDLTNYVMLETGQPLHAFDLDLLAGPEIIVREAREGECLTTLDGVERELKPHHMVIADRDKPVALAGIMGGAETEVSAATKRCLLESAHFMPLSVRKTRKEQGLQTEASYRFERHVDPEGVQAALNRFEELYREITGKASLPGVVLDRRSYLPAKEVSVSLDRVRRLLALDVPANEATAILTRLGFETHLTDGVITALPPSWRADIAREDDLTEEIGRIYGYEKFGEILPQGTTPLGGTHGAEALLDDLIAASLRCGFNQAISHSLGDSHPLDEEGEKIRVRQPHSPEMAWLRNSLLPSLAQVVARNGGRDQAWFEAGRVFPAEGEEDRVGFILTGQVGQPHPEQVKIPATFLRLKGAIEKIAQSVGRELDFVAHSGDSRLHPTRQALLTSGGQPVGILGQIHPDMAEAAGLAATTCLAELELPPLYGGGTPAFNYRVVSRHPAALRDIAVLAPKSLSYSEIEKAVGQAGGAELERQWLFDIYEGKGIPEGHHSLAIGLQMRKPSGTFTDEEANQVRDRIVSALELLGAKLR